MIHEINKYLYIFFFSLSRANASQKLRNVWHQHRIRIFFRSRDKLTRSHPFPRKWGNSLGKKRGGGETWSWHRSLSLLSVNCYKRRAITNFRVRAFRDRRDILNDITLDRRDSIITRLCQRIVCEFDQFRVFSKRRLIRSSFSRHLIFARVARSAPFIPVTPGIYRHCSCFRGVSVCGSAQWYREMRSRYVPTHNERKYQYLV